MKISRKSWRRLKMRVRKGQRMSQESWNKVYRNPEGSSYPLSLRNGSRCQRLNICCGSFRSFLAPNERLLLSWDSSSGARWHLASLAGRRSKGKSKAKSCTSSCSSFKASWISPPLGSLPWWPCRVRPLLLSPAPKGCLQLYNVSHLLFLSSSRFCSHWADKGSTVLRMNDWLQIKGFLAVVLIIVLEISVHCTWNRNLKKKTTIECK